LFGYQDARWWGYLLHALVRLPSGSSRGKQQQRSSQYYINLKSKTTMTKACINIIAASTKITISFHVSKDEKYINK
jgi:hypothetical protein